MSEFACFVPCSPRAQNCSRASADLLARIATRALIDEANLTPKPALVDRRGPGAHSDMDLEMMRRSADSLFATFRLIARIAEAKRPSHELRELVGAAGREGERQMLAGSGGSNTHRGAIWTLGLLVAGAAMGNGVASAKSIAGRAANLARFPDSFAPDIPTNGSIVLRKFGVGGARWEAMRGFPHIVRIGLPALNASRTRGLSEERARLDTLMAIMSSLPDTCILHRAGWPALDAARKGAQMVLQKGGTATSQGIEALLRLDSLLIGLNASPGGSADLLAGTLFLDRLLKPRGKSTERRSVRPSDSTELVEVVRLSSRRSLTPRSATKGSCSCSKEPGNCGRKQRCQFLTATLE